MKPTIDMSSASRRDEAVHSEDPSTLAALICDENFFVRRRALANECTPRDVVELLVRTGASPDLRGKGQLDANVSLRELKRLAALGPFGRELVAAHPNADEQVLAAIASEEPVSLMATILKHPHCPAKILKAACVSMDAEHRRLAAAHPHSPTGLLEDLRRAGVDAQLQTMRPPQEPLPVEAIERLAALGRCGRVIAAAQRNCPPAILEEIAQDQDWRVRLAVLENPSTPTATLQHLLSIDDDRIRLRLLEHPNVPPTVVMEAAKHPHLEVRIAAARHPHAPHEALRALAADGAHQVREVVAQNPQTPRDIIDQLRRLGSADDLLNFDAPDLELSAAEIADLVSIGLWARRLAAQHPNTNAATLQTLACDGDHVVRQWVSKHPNLPADFLTLLQRTGALPDLLGTASPDLQLGPSELESIARLGPWAARLVARHPNTSDSTLEVLARSDDPALRVAAASHANTPSRAISILVRDAVPEVRFAAANHARLCDDDATHLASDAIAGIRSALIRNGSVSDHIIAKLETDTNPDIAGAARARRSSLPT